jgi:hypothetical protein
MRYPKIIVQSFYKSDALIDVEVMKDYLHSEIILDWNSSKGFVQMDYDSILNMAHEMSKAYVRSKVRISHIVCENDMVSVRYSQYVKTIENPREEMFLANFITIWQLKDNKLYRGYQMSQIC